MLLCTNCGKAPAQAYTRRAGGKEVTVLLCPACYRKLYPEKESSFFLSVLGGADGVDAVCPVCGTNYKEFRRTGLLGCAGCYEAFRAPLTETVRSLHGSILHRGKRPVRLGAEERYDRLMADTARRAALREEMEQAMREHDYARAGELRRLLKAMASAKEER